MDIIGISAAFIWLVMVVIYVASKRPTHDRDWRVDLRVLPRVEREGNTVTVHNMRNVRYGDPNTPYNMSYTTRTFDLQDVVRVWFVQETFGAWRAVAHTFLSFELADGRCLAVSLEARIPAGERYSLFRGVLNSFEMMVIIGDEQDLIGRRAKYQQHVVHLYPLTLTPQQGQTLLALLLDEANSVLERPRFYNTLYRSCTSHLFRLLNRAAPGSVPLRLGTFIPGYSDGLLFNQGLIADVSTNTPINAEAAQSSQWREAFYISDLVRDYADAYTQSDNNQKGNHQKGDHQHDKHGDADNNADDAAFSQAIRQQLPREHVPS